MSDKKKYKIVSIGRSLIDITVILSEKDFINIQYLLSVKPGEWVEIQDFDKLNKIFRTIANRNYPQKVKELKKILNQQNIFLSAGSTNYNVFSQFSTKTLNNSAIITSIGINQDLETDIFSSYFTQFLRDKNIDHIAYPYNGNNPISLVFVSPSNPEKILASFLGISGNLDKISDFDTEYVYIDAYELNKGKISTLLDDIIQKRKYKIILGLGNETILNGVLLERIGNYLSNGLIQILLGNSNEYYKLCPFSNAKDIVLSSIFSKVTHMLVTQGANGMYGFINGKIYYQDAIEIKNIINTSGAGDAASGAFISEIIADSPDEQILNKAALAAFNALSKNS